MLTKLADGCGQQECPTILQIWINPFVGSSAALKELSAIKLLHLKNIIHVQPRFVKFITGKFNAIRV